MSKSPYDILRTLIERIILPKYQTLSIESIDSYLLTANREYDVRFYTTKKIPPEVQEEIDTEVKTLFKMAGLDEVENGRYENNIIAVWFKRRGAKDWSFHSTPGYKHI